MQRVIQDGLAEVKGCGVNSAGLNISKRGLKARQRLLNIEGEGSLAHGARGGEVWEQLLSQSCGRGDDVGMIMIFRRPYCAGSLQRGLSEADVEAFVFPHQIVIPRSAPV